MAVFITDECVTCGACLWECPTEAIAPGDPRPVVDPELCTECLGFFGESQCAVVCPVHAIALRHESEEALAGRYARLYPAREPQDTWIWRRLGSV
ncbi:MAG TPA: 4Fe-4S binding protein [Actinomycetes bacterium]